jgi:hypothetical protein
VVVVQALSPTRNCLVIIKYLNAEPRPFIQHVYIFEVVYEGENYLPQKFDCNNKKGFLSVYLVFPSSVYKHSADARSHSIYIFMWGGVLKTNSVIFSKVENSENQIIEIEALNMMKHM